MSCPDGLVLCLEIIKLRTILQVWRSSQDRDHPDTIKRRFVSAGFMTIISPVFVYQFGSPELLDQYSLAEIIGLKTGGLFSAVVLPLLLTVILFLGPIAMLLLDVSHSTPRPTTALTASADCFVPGEVPSVLCSDVLATVTQRLDMVEESRGGSLQ